MPRQGLFASPRAIRALAAMGASAAAVLTAFACSSDDAPAPAPEVGCTPDVASVHQRVVAPACLGSGCHGSADRAGDLDLSTPEALAAMVRAPASTCGETLVIPSDPEGSFFYDKLASATPACGARMPLGGALDADAVACVASWIAAVGDSCETCGGDQCVDVTSDPAHCGRCGTACPAGVACEGGTCACPGGATFCGGACVDVTADPAHCGDCDAPCDPGLFCSLSSCKDGCDAGLLECGTSCVDSASSEAHCGDCDRPCESGQVCEGGSCACPDGGDPQTDPTNCGTCGHVCASGLECVAGECTCGASSVSFSADVQPIFTANCASNACHGGVMPSASLDLRAGEAHGQLVGIPSSQCASRALVTPGDPDASYLLNKILGVDMCFGSKMPKMGSITAAQEQAIAAWICGGANDD